MAIEKKEIEFAKEVDDALVFLVELVKDIKAGKNAAQIAAENLPGLMNAIGSADQIPEEFKSSEVFLQTVGYRFGDMVSAFINKA
jgi:hypothetical protein